MNKVELLNILTKTTACADALEWICRQQSNDAKAIYENCFMPGWLCYLYLEIFAGQEDWRSPYEVLEETCNNQYGRDPMFITYEESLIAPRLTELFIKYANAMRIEWEIIEGLLYGYATA